MTMPIVNCLLGAAVLGDQLLSLHGERRSWFKLDDLLPALDGLGRLGWLCTDQALAQAKENPFILWRCLGGAAHFVGALAHEILVACACTVEAAAGAHISPHAGIIGC